MSSALLKQALTFVDPEVSENGKNKRGLNRRSRRAATRGQGLLKKNKKTVKQVSTSLEVTEDNIKKLLALSQPSADPAAAGKIIERAIKGKPLADKIEVKTEEVKSILFPEDETFKQFEKEYFCS